METPSQRFQRVLDENNLTGTLLQPKIRFVQDGAVLIEQPVLSVTFTDPTKEVEPIVEPITQPATAEEVSNESVAESSTQETNETTN